MRRYLYLFIIVAVIILIVLVLLFLRNRAAMPSGSDTGITPGGLPGVGTQSNPPPSTPGGTDGTSGNAAPPYAGQKFGVVAPNKVLSYYVDPQNNATLVQPDGQIVKISNGNAVTLSSSAISGLISADFSYDGNKILAFFGDPAKPQASVFDITTKSWQPLLQNIISAAWSPTNYQIVYTAPGSGVSALATMDLSNIKAKPVVLATLHAIDLSLSWPSANQIMILSKGSAASNGSAWSFDVKKKTFQKIVGDATGLDSIWNGTVGLGLAFIAGNNQYGGALTIYDPVGNIVNNLSFLTLPEKCTFGAEVKTVAPAAAASVTTSSKTTTAPVAQTIEKLLYCAIPRDHEKMNASRLPDDYQTKSLFTEDNFYKISLASGNTASLFADQNQALDAVNPRVFGQTLFFVNRIDQKLYAISLN